MKTFLIAIFLIHSINSQLPDVTIHFFGQNLADYKSFTYNQSIINDFAALSDVYYDDNKKSVIYIHSWLENFISDGPQAVLNAYFTRKDEFNIGFINWSSYSMDLMVLTVIPRLSDVARISKEMIHQMIEGRIDTSKLQLVGFGLGAIIAGDIGREIQKEGMKLSQIIGLDVGSVLGMTAESLGDGCKLQRTDADFVQIIHTNAGQMGEGLACGHVDFWPSGGANQPNCPVVTVEIINELENLDSINQIFCSHHRAFYYFAESVTKNTAAKTFPFLSNQCNYTSTAGQKCSAYPTASMGYYADITTTNRSPNVTLNYSLNVGDKPPYSDVNNNTKKKSL